MDDLFIPRANQVPKGLEHVTGDVLQPHQLLVKLFLGDFAARSMSHLVAQFSQLSDVRLLTLVRHAFGDVNWEGGC